jgi:alginate O-acetyltransferase complex protein AlgI
MALTPRQRLNTPGVRIRYRFGQMLFQSQVFLLAFLPAVVTIWYGLAWLRAAVCREWALVGLSLIFYGWWDVRFVPLLLTQTVLSWVVAQIYIRTGRRFGWLIWLAIAANLMVLGFFKYAAFFAENAAALAGWPVEPLSIILPIGISFFTFEIISYLADLRWHGAPSYPLRRFMLVRFAISQADCRADCPPS